MGQVSEGYVSGDGVKIHYYRTGGGEKPSVVLLHGFTDSGACWPLVQRDLATEYDLVLPDARGHGLSGGPENGFSHELLAADVAGVIRELQLQKPALLGHSMGAQTAAVVAAHYPDLVRAVVLEDPPWHAVVPEETQTKPTSTDKLEDSSWYQWLAPLKAQTPEERLQTARKQNPGWAEEELPPWADSKAQFDFAVLRFGLPPSRWRDLLSQISCPILLLTGDPDRGAIVTPEVAQEASHIWRNGQLVHIAGAGHNLRREQYARYKEAIEAFLRQH